jgi:hypothetical protein
MLMHTVYISALIEVTEGRVVHVSATEVSAACVLQKLPCSEPLRVRPWVSQ